MCGPPGRISHVCPPRRAFAQGTVGEGKSPFTAESVKPQENDTFLSETNMACGIEQKLRKWGKNRYPF